MRQSLVPVLLLAAVALSSSNLLPMITTDRLESIDVNGQQNDNILSNKYNTRDLSTIFYTIPLRSQQSNRLLRKLTKFMNTNNDRADENINDTGNEDDHYDDEGFRKEQWHNYPRQLDRLHAYLLDYRNGNLKRRIDTDDPGIEDYAPVSKESSIGDRATNEYLMYNNEENHLDESDVAVTNPLIILRVHLARLSDRLKNTEGIRPKVSLQKDYKNGEDTDMEEKIFTNDINPAAKVKREGAEEIENSEENSTSEKKIVNKRLFSLWSRLQSMSHKGHELPHRRHLAFYGFPDADMTAETRATMMRPPGSPLRWG